MRQSAPGDPVWLEAGVASSLLGEVQESSSGRRFRTDQRFLQGRSLGSSRIHRRECFVFCPSVQTLHTEIRHRGLSAGLL